MIGKQVGCAEAPKVGRSDLFWYRDLVRTDDTHRHLGGPRSTTCVTATLIVWKLDRLGRSLAHLIETVTALAARGIGIRSLTEAIDTTTSGGRLVFHLFSALSRFERDLIQERTRAGLAAAVSRGR